MKIVLPPFLKKFALASIAGAVALVCILVFLFRFSAVSELKEELNRAESDVLIMRRNIKNSQNLEEQLNSIIDLTDKVRARTVDPEDAAVNTAYFYEFEDDGVQIEAVEQRPGDGTQDPGPWKMKNFGSVKFTIRAVGTFREVTDFAYRIRGGEKLVRLLNLSVVPADDQGANQRRLVMTLEALSSLPETGTEDDK